MTFDAFNESVGACGLLVPAIDLVSQHLHTQGTLGIKRWRVAGSRAGPGHHAEPLRIIHMQQVTEPAAEVVLLRARFRSDQAGIPFQRRPTAAALAGAGSVDVVQRQRLVVQESPPGAHR